MKKIVLLLVVFGCMHDRLVAQSSNSLTYDYLMEIKIHITGTGGHSAEAGSRMAVTVVYQDDTRDADIITVDLKDVAKHDDRPYTKHLIFSSAKKVKKLEVYSKRRTCYWFFGWVCKDQFEKTEDVDDIVYPCFSKVYTGKFEGYNGTLTLNIHPANHEQVVKLSHNLIVSGKKFFIGIRPFPKCDFSDGTTSGYYGAIKESPANDFSSFLYDDYIFIDKDKVIKSITLAIYNYSYSIYYRKWSISDQFYKTVNIPRVPIDIVLSDLYKESAPSFQNSTLQIQITTPSIPLQIGAQPNVALPDNVLASEDPITIFGPNENYTDFFNWQYSFDASHWHDFPQWFMGKNPISFSANDMLAVSNFRSADYIDKNVFIRIAPCSGTITSSSKIVRICKSPPKIVDGGGDGGGGSGGGGITVTPPNCSDSNDGKVTLTFSRALDTGESLVLTLYKCVNTGIIDKSENTSDTFIEHQQIDNLGSDQKYIFPKDFGSGDYYFKYFGKSTLTDSKISSSNIKFSNFFTVTAPSPVTFTYTPVNVSCHKGNDGSITVTAGGGNGNYHYMIKREGQVDSEWKPFLPASSSIPGLEAAKDWTIQIRDGKQCYAKESNGNIISRVVQITEPPHPLVNNLVSKTNPLGYGRADGSITVDVSGGTTNAGTYHYQWTNLAGENITSNITANVSGTGYRIEITHLPDGIYTLTTTDNLYSTATATSNAGCKAVNEYELEEPPPLVATIAIQDSILCHGNANGSLVAHAKGGVPYISGLPYRYTWKKKKEKDNVFEVIPNQTDNIIQTDSTIANLSTGTYAVSIEDANKIVIDEETTFFFLQPAKLEVNAASTPVSCNGLPKGTATAIASGGTPAYTYTWSNGKTTPAIDALPAGIYLVYVKDYRLCETQKNIEVLQPNAIHLSVDRRDPTCHNGQDGSLTVTITGGVAPYRYTWTGATSTGPAATNLGSGNYGISIIDDKNCTVLSNYTLDNPSPLPLSLGQDRFICSTQNITYDITIPDKMITYQWESNNGFSSHDARVVLTQKGIYYAGVTDAKGCNSKDTLVLTAQNTVINNEFALPTQVYQREQIVVVNTSNPQPDSLQWVLPPQAVITQQNNKYAAFTLANTGAYFVKLITYRGRCYAEETKKVIVLTPHNLNSIGVAPEPFIQAFSAVPNPNNGNFLVSVVLKSIADMQLRLINVASSQTVISEHLSGSDSYSIPVNVSVNPGVYVVVVETPNGYASLKLIIF